MKRGIDSILLETRISICHLEVEYPAAVLLSLGYKEILPLPGLGIQQVYKV